MTKFKCRNCNNVFDKFCDVCRDAENVKCPSCKSHWVEIYYEKEKKKFNPWPPGLYDDPIYPVPNIDPFPCDRPSHWPKEDGWIVTYKKINNDVVYSMESAFGKIW